MRLPKVSGLGAGSGKKSSKLSRVPIHDGNSDAEEKKENEVNSEGSKDLSAAPHEPDIPPKPDVPDVSKTTASKTSTVAGAGNNDNAEKKKHLPINLKYVMIIIIVAIIYVDYRSYNPFMFDKIREIMQNPVMSSNGNEIPLAENQLKDDTFIREMNSIIKMLENTRTNLRYVNRSLTIHIRDDPPAKPATILLLGTNKSECALCICLWRFINALSDYYSENQPLKSGLITAHDFTYRDGNQGKLLIEESVEVVAKSGEYIPVVVMDDIDHFPVSSLSKVHAYVDHENAPHKNIIYILTAVISKEVELEVKKNNQLVQIATEHFDESWLQYDRDHRRALLGRITPVIGLVHQGQLKNDFINGEIDKKVIKKCESKCGGQNT